MVKAHLELIDELSQQVIDPTVAAAAVGGRRAIYGPAVTHGHSGPFTYGMSRRSNNSSGSSLDGSLRDLIQ